MQWMGQYDGGMGYGNMDGSNMGMGGHMGNMMNPPPPPPNSAPQQPPLPPGSSGGPSSNWQQQSWGANSSDGDGQEPPGESKSTESSNNNEYEGMKWLLLAVRYKQKSLLYKTLILNQLETRDIQVR